MDNLFKKSKKIALVFAMTALAFDVAADQASDLDVAGADLNAVTQEVTTLSDRQLGIIPYPKREIMVDVYLNMAKDNYVLPGVGITSPNITTELLETVFDRAESLGLVDDAGFYRTNSKDPSKAIFPVSKATASSSCLGAAFACASATVGTGWAWHATKAACSSAAVQGGVDAPNDGACAAAAVAAGVTTLSGVAGCTKLFADCKHQNPQATHATAISGTQSGTVTEKYCPNSGKAAAIRLHDYSNVLGQIQITCNDGTVLTFGKNPSELSLSGQCSQRRLLAGLLTRSGDRVDAASGICDTVGRTDDQSSDFNIGWFGGSGGSRKDLYCPEHQYIIGMKSWHSPTVSSATSRINAIQIFCK